MATSEDLSKRLSELYRCVDDLKACASKDPDQIEKILSSALEKLEASMEELSAADEELCQQNEELVEAAEEREKNLSEISEANERLRESEERYRSLFSGMTEGFALHEIICDDQGMPIDFRFLDINPAFEELTGLRREDVIGKTHNEVLPDDNPRWVKEYGAVALTGKSTRFENYSPVLKRHYEVFAYRSAPLQFAVLFMDITERKRAEEELRYHADLVENVSDAIISTDRELKIRSWNKGAERVYGWQADEVIGRVGSDILRTTFPEWLSRETIARDIFEKGGWDGELIQKTKDGRDITVHARSMAIKDEAGNVIGGVSISHDITERKQAEEERQRLTSELADRASELQAVLDAAPAAIWIAHDPQCWKITGNAYADQLLEAQPGGNISCSALPGDTAVSYKTFRNGIELQPEELPAQIATATGKLVSGAELELVFPDGHSVHLLANAMPLFDAEGHVRGSITAGVDITQIKLGKQALQKANDELERRVQKRTADLAKANVELMKARDVAEAAVEAKAAFLANMSHELRTPMNAVIGFSSLLLDDNLTPDQKDYVERIRNGGEILLALINDILDFSKMEKKKIELEHRPLSLRALAEESLGMVAPAAANKGLNLAYKDTGIGIPKDKMDLLFLPFSQVEASISSQRGGTGLGLAISKRLVELMDGKIWADSIPKVGSTFQFTIEAEVAPGELVDSWGPAATAFENLAEERPMRILVAEDVPSNQKVLVEILKRMGYRADMAADGREVLEALERQPYDLILMDIKMPEMDGIAAAREIRKRWPNNGPKIIAITAYALEGDREKCLEAGMDDYIAKPVKKDDLAALLRNIAI